MATCPNCGKSEGQKEYRLRKILAFGSTYKDFCCDKCRREFKEAHEDEEWKEENPGCASVIIAIFAIGIGIAYGVSSIIG